MRTAREQLRRMAAERKAPSHDFSWAGVHVGARPHAQPARCHGGGVGWGGAGSCSQLTFGAQAAKERKETDVLASSTS